VTLRLPPAPSMLREALLLLYTGIWGTVVVTQAFHGQPITQEMWAALPLGLGGIHVALRAGSKKRTEDDDREDES
jgi:hypothetical protein